MSERRRSEPLGVVAGYDGSAASEATVVRGADEAVRRRTSLAVVIATGGPGGERPDGEDGADGEAERSLRDVVHRVRRRHPALVVTGHRVRADGASGLREMAERAVLLVVGARGAGAAAGAARGDAAGAGLGSVTAALLRLAACPVLVVPGTATPDPVPASRRSLVVAGVDGDQTATAVLRAALDEAARTNGRVRLLHTYPDRPPGAGLQRARAFCRDLVREVSPGGSGVTAVVTPESPEVALLRHATGADVVVIGARGSAVTAGLLAESVSRAVMRAVPCAVLVVTPRAAGRLLPRQGPPAGVARLPSARVSPELAARFRAHQASPPSVRG